MPRAIVPPTFGEERDSFADSQRRPSLSPGEIIVHPPKEDPVMAQRVDAFLRGYDRLSKEQKIAKAQLLKTSDPKLYTAVQGRITRRNTQEARTLIDASQASRDQAREVDKVITDRQTQTSDRALAVPGKPPKSA